MPLQARMRSSSGFLSPPVYSSCKSWIDLRTLSAVLLLFTVLLPPTLVLLPLAFSGKRANLARSPHPAAGLVVPGGGGLPAIQITEAAGTELGSICEVAFPPILIVFTPMHRAVGMPSNRLAIASAGEHYAVAVETL